MIRAQPFSSRSIVFEPNVAEAVQYRALDRAYFR
jgi:hypothetical protein